MKRRENCRTMLCHITYKHIYLAVSRGRDYDCSLGSYYRSDLGQVCTTALSLYFFLPISFYYIFVSKFEMSSVCSTFRQLREYSLFWESVVVNHTSHMTCPSEVYVHKKLLHAQDVCSFEYFVR